MAKFSGQTRPLRTQGTASVRTKEKDTATFEGGDASKFDARSELFLLAVTNMVGESTFYESATTRDERFTNLVHKVTKKHPEWLAGADPDAGNIGFVQYLRETMLMRSASTVMAAEYAAAGGAGARSVIARALQRPDEPAELIGYWLATHGRKIPMPVKRGVADAVVRLYNERAVLRYNSQNAGVRMADVIELVHPQPKDDAQSALFKHLLDDRHHEASAPNPTLLPMLHEHTQLMAVPEDRRRSVLTDDPERLARAGWSWERLSGWLPGGMDAEAWQFAIPNMGVMALVRNLRNFDEKGISEKFVDEVTARISAEDEVKRSRLFPYQVWSAYKNAPSDNWKKPLGRTLDLTTKNIPDLDGTLVVIDTSGSMDAAVSARSQMTRVELAAVMAMATAKRSAHVDVVIFGVTNKRVDIPAGRSVLAGVQQIASLVGSVGHSTYGHTAIKAHFDPKRHRRVVMFTDDQQHDSGSVNLSHVPLIYTFDLAGYGRSSLGAGKDGRYTLGGFTDATFTAMKVLEGGKSTGWPF